MNNKITYNNKELYYNSIELYNLPPNISNQKFIGKINTIDGVILFSTNDNGVDCIWEIEDLSNFSNEDITLLYVRDLNFSSNNPIQGIFNYENDKIQKIYWVDGVNQTRHLNIKRSIVNGDATELIDQPKSSIDFVPSFNITTPTLISLNDGGSHTAGVIQYCYSLYNINGSITSLSPFSKLISLSTSGVINEDDDIINVASGKSPNILINNIDTNYEYIKIYSVKYSSFNEIPEINLIKDAKITSYTDYTFSDTGSSLGTVPLEDFIFIGSSPTVSEHITSKDNRLFQFNIKDQSYDLDLDMRAYSHDNNGVCKLYSGVTYVNNSLNFVTEDTFENNIDIDDYNYSEDKDSINPNFDVYRFHKDGTTIGGEGKFISYSLIDIYSTNPEIKTFKDNDIYRIGIKFYNEKGQSTDVKWIADFKSRTELSNLTLNKTSLKVDVNLDAINQRVDELINNNLATFGDKPVGYQIVRAERNELDKLVVTQGVSVPLITQSTYKAKDSTFWSNSDNLFSRIEKDEVKKPLYLSRPFYTPSNYKVKASVHGDPISDSEVSISDDRIHRSFMYTKLHQTYSPDTIFNNTMSLDDTVTFNIIGCAKRNNFSYISSMANDSGSLLETIEKSDNGDLWFHNWFRYGNASNSLVATTGVHETLNNMNLLRYHQNYNTFIQTPLISTSSIVGTPEVSARGQGVTNYNNDSSKRYSNNLNSFITGRGRYYRKRGNKDKDYGVTLNKITSYGGRCITAYTDTPIEEIFENTLLSDLDRGGLPVVEFVKPISYYYKGNMYKGIDRFNRVKTSYIDCSEYTNINNSSLTIHSPGDTFIGEFNFGRMLRDDQGGFSNRNFQMSETLSFICETTINLKERSDITTSGDTLEPSHPTYGNYHIYNKVYNQESNLIKSSTDSLFLKSTLTSNNKIIASSAKVTGEIIDSWTNTLENEEMLLDGKYGSINGVINYNDTLYALQSGAIANIIVNPKAQVTTNEGEELQLGTGNVLYDYKYITTKSGTINKWSVLETNNSFLYLDLNNKSIFKVIGNQVQDLAEASGLHSFFQNRIDFESIKVDNPFLNSGVSTGFNVNNQDAYFTFLQGDSTFTISHNGKSNSFTSLYDYTPSMYINRGSVMLTTNVNNTELWSHFKGEYGNFYNSYNPSYIIFQVNPLTNVTCTFNNISYQSEAYIDGADAPNNTFTSIKSWNDYQNTGDINLVLGRNKNLRRKFRQWSALIPRNQNSRDRIRNQWMMLKLEYNKDDNSKFILHDIDIIYEV